MTPAAAIRDSFQRAWRLRWRLMAAHLAVTLLTLGVLSPVAGGVVRLAVALTGSPALADHDIAAALLSPAGAVGLVAVASTLIASAVIGAAVMMAIDLADRRDARLGLREALVFIGRRLPAILAFAAHLTLRVLVIVLPFALVAALEAERILSGHDINHHLAARTPELVRAVLIAGGILAVPAIILADRLTAWSLSLPAILFARAGPREAFRESERLTEGRRWGLFGLFLLWAAVATALGAAAMAVAGAAAGAALMLAGPDLGSSAVAALAALTVWGVAQFFVSAMSTGGLAVLLSRLLARSGVEIDARFARPDRRPGVAVTAAGALLAVAAALTAAGGVALVETAAAKDKAVVIAHRAGAEAAPENTLAAIEKAVEQGADWIEIDVQTTADGEVIVIHDRDFMRVGGEPLRVSDATMEDVARIDVGRWFGAGFEGEKAPTLRAALEAAKGRIKVLIELKIYDDAKGLEQRVAEIVEAAGMTGSVAAMSLDHSSARRMKALRPDWRVGLLVATAVGDLSRLEADFLAVRASVASAPFIRHARTQGKPVYVWTLNTPVQMSRALSRGAAGIITDRPALAREVLADRAEMGPLERALVHAADAIGLTPAAREVRAPEG